MDPKIADPFKENQRVVSEGLDKAMLGGLEQMLAQGGTDPIVVAKLEIAMRADPTAHFADVYVKVHEEMQAQQAAQQQAAAQQPAALGAGPPGLTGGGPPAAQMPGAAVPPGGRNPTIPPAPGGQVDLTQILQTLRRPANQGPVEQGAA